MAKFLTTSHTTATIETIITEAEERLVLMSPYWKWPYELHTRVKQADRRGVHITVVFGKKDLARDQRDRMAELKNSELLYCETLHAKCYANEKLLVVSSLNLYESSQGSNREMSVSLERGEEAFSAAMREVLSIVDASERIAPLSQQPFRDAGAAAGILTERAERVRTASNGYCIRCRCPLELNPGKPFCYQCWDEWAGGDEPTHRRDYCHRCGERRDTSLDRPVCLPCYRAAS